MKWTTTLAAVLLLAACGGGSDQQAEAISGGAETTAASVTSTTTSPPATTTTELAVDTTDSTTPSVTTEELGEGLPVTGSYGLLEVSVTSATLGNVVPRTYLDEPEPDTATWLFLDLTVVNVDASENVLLGDLAWTVTVDGAAQPAPEVVDGMRTVVVSANAAEDTVLAFEVPEGTSFDQIELMATEPDRVPMILPLTTEPVPSPYPIDIDVTGSGPAQGSGTGCRQVFDVNVRGATAGIQSPLIDRHIASAYGSYRAEVGERLLGIDVVMLNTGGGSCSGGVSNLDNGDFRIVIDGVPKEPVNWTAELIDVDTAFEGMIVFVVPVDATDVEFQAGSSDETLFSLPVPIEGLPPAPGE